MMKIAYFFSVSRNKIFKIIGTHTQLWTLRIKNATANKILKPDFCIFKYLLLFVYGTFHMLYILHNRKRMQYHTSNKRCLETCVTVLFLVLNLLQPSGYVMHQQV